MTSFFDGYSEALSNHLLPWQNEKPSLNAFQAWVKTRLALDNLSMDWKHAMRAAYSDDKDAIVQMRKLLADFQIEYDAGNVADPPPRR
ncbi:hypothetical protein [Rubripirellula reticaptiva]|nr:hypothetical protein [Rubripirellula reticaptiva]